MKMQKIKKLACGFGVTLALSLGLTLVANAAETLKIGFVGVTSGPKAASKLVAPPITSKS